MPSGPGEVVDAKGKKESACGSIVRRSVLAATGTASVSLRLAAQRSVQDVSWELAVHCGCFSSFMGSGLTDNAPGKPTAEGALLQNGKACAAGSIAFRTALVADAAARLPDGRASCAELALQPCGRNKRWRNSSSLMQRTDQTRAKLPIIPRNWGSGQLEKHSKRADRWRWMSARARWSAGESGLSQRRRE